MDVDWSLQITMCQLLLPRFRTWDKAMNEEAYVKGKCGGGDLAVTCEVCHVVLCVVVKTLGSDRVRTERSEQDVYRFAMRIGNLAGCAFGMLICGKKARLVS